VEGVVVIMREDSVNLLFLNRGSQYVKLTNFGISQAGVFCIRIAQIGNYFKVVDISG